MASLVPSGWVLPLSLFKEIDGHAGGITSPTDRPAGKAQLSPRSQIGCLSLSVNQAGVSSVTVAVLPRSRGASSSRQRSPPLAAGARDCGGALALQLEGFDDRDAGAEAAYLKPTSDIAKLHWQAAPGILSVLQTPQPSSCHWSSLRRVSSSSTLHHLLVSVLHVVLAAAAGAALVLIVGAVALGPARQVREALCGCARGAGRRGGAEPEC